MNRTAKLLVAASVLAAGIAIPADAQKAHSWSTYHWARTTTSFNLKVVDSTTSAWDFAFSQSLVEWNKSSKLENVVVAVDESSRARKQCRAVSGQMRVCNAAYGQNGWLGLASINIDSSGHITQGTAKMNDSYASYFASNPGEDNHVMCQEIGHVYGLGHTSEDGSSQGTCMDYSTSLNSQWPNAHDYQQLDAIYNHVDSYNTYKALSPDGGNCRNCDLAGVPSDAVRVNFKPGREDEFGHADFVKPDGRGGFWVYHATLLPGEGHHD
jgi:hypothetical protein